MSNIRISISDWNVSISVNNKRVVSSWMWKSYSEYQFDHNDGYSNEYKCVSWLEYKNEGNMKNRIGL